MAGFLSLVDKQQWLDRVAGQLQPSLAAGFSPQGATGRKFVNFLHGTWLGHPLHPVLTDVPVGSWTAAAVLDALDAFSERNRFARGADTAIAVGLIGATGAALTGLADWSKMGHGHARRIGVAHGLINVAGFACYTTSLILRRRNSRAAAHRFALFGLLATTAAAYLGGHLIYREHVGVDHTAKQKMPYEFVPVLALNDLAENQMKRVELNGTPILLARTGGRIYAIGETCAHLGGPLAAGKLQDGSVICPWHGSRYALEDGSVLDGPSAHPQPAFEVRVRGGQVEVRSAVH